MQKQKEDVTKSSKVTKSGTKSQRGRSTAWEFPQLPLEEALWVARSISDFNALRPAKADLLAKILGYSPNSSAFQRVLRSAKQYDLVSSSGARGDISLTEIGLDIVAPTSPDKRQKALLKAFYSVDLFGRVADLFPEKRLPEYEFFANTLVRDFGIPRSAVDTVIKVYTENLEYLKAFSSSSEVSSQPIIAAMSPQQVSNEGEPTIANPVSESDNVREFLDTCFILMPFGEWFDKYFKEIYIPATKDAGFEPLRADGLFNTGAVMEQIWAQIRKSKVLLADLNRQESECIL